ncbi:MAG: hypothetical protein JXR76_01205 [Deltaproteobacteria bacterium]|nr:hypothetical protein [Deltaproteobacteria bacterium]
MDLTPLEQWQMLCLLQTKRQHHELSESECFALHHLLLWRIGDAYQRIACGVPTEPLSPLSIELAPEIITISSEDGRLCRQMTVADEKEDFPIVQLSQCTLLSCTTSPADYRDHLHQKMRHAFTDFTGITPEPLAAPSKELSFQRKWRKFRRDPLLFFKDFLIKNRSPK